MDIILLLWALIGHAFLWVALVNRIHGTAMPHGASRSLTLLCLACLVLLPVGFGLWCFSSGLAAPEGLAWPDVPWPVLFYLGTCWVAAAMSVVWWVGRVAVNRPPHLLRFHRTRSVQLDEDAARQQPRHFLVRLPGNEILQLDVTERAIDVPRLVPALDGLSIVHFSDLHFTGRVAKPYFQEVVRRCNRIDADLVAITGDLVDHSDFIDWIPDTLGRLRARHGVYFVLGNHDVRVDTDRLRRVLKRNGLIDLGGRWLQVDVCGEPVILAGNELPWIVPAADMRSCPPRTADGGPLRIVLSHSPDQLGWAQARDVDLLLAGHTHGGQIRFPLIGPIFSPSSAGVKYASGLFYAPPTIMHVTRGLSGELPVRLNCPPEMAHLMLHALPRPENGIGGAHDALPYRKPQSLAISVSRPPAPPGRVE